MYEDLDYINDFDKVENDEENITIPEVENRDDLNITQQQSQQSEQEEYEEEQYATPNYSSPPKTRINDHPLPFPQSSNTLVTSLPITYQLEIPTSSTPSMTSQITTQTTIPISNESIPETQENTEMNSENSPTSDLPIISSPPSSSPSSFPSSPSSSSNSNNKQIRESPPKIEIKQVESKVNL